MVNPRLFRRNYALDKLPVTAVFPEITDSFRDKDLLTRETILLLDGAIRGEVSTERYGVYLAENEL